MTAESDARLEEVKAALRLAYSFFERRDHMNSAVHDQPVRWSPITTKVFRALDTVNDLILEANAHNDRGGDSDARA